MYEQCTRMLPRNDALWTGVQNEVTLSSVQTTRTVRLRSRLTFRSGRHFTQVTKDDTTPQYPYSSPTRDRPRVHMRHYHSQNRTSVLRHPSHKHRAKKCHWRGQWRSLGSTLGSLWPAAIPPAKRPQACAGARRLRGTCSLTSSSVRKRPAQSARSTSSSVRKRPAREIPAAQPARVASSTIRSVRKRPAVVASSTSSSVRKRPASEISAERPRPGGELNHPQRPKTACSGRELVHEQQRPKTACIRRKRNKQQRPKKACTERALNKQQRPKTACT